MAVIVNNQKINIIDKSLLEIAESSAYLNYIDIKYYLALLKKIAVDLVEIDSKVIKKVGNLPPEADYIFRIETNQDIKIIAEHKFNYLIISYKKAFMFDEAVAAVVNNAKIILEVDADDLDRLFLDENNQILNKYNIWCLRVNNMSRYNFNGQKQLIKDIKSKFSVMVDFCASNELYMATAISVDACLEGADYITACFCGQEFNLSPLEEVILALKILYNSKILGEVKLFSKLSMLYSKISKKNVSCMKPVLGSDIFKYESGIHADGIEKNPKTFEPYSPEEIGQTRKLYIGKHSGKRAVQIKLEELKLDYRNIDLEMLLRLVRERSIKLKRSIKDSELAEIFNTLVRE